MAKAMTATESRIHLGHVLKMVEDGGEHIAVAKDGVEAAYILSPGDLGRLDQRRKLVEWVQGMQEAREIVARAFGGQKPPTARELIDGGRDDIDEE